MIRRLFFLLPLLFFMHTSHAQTAADSARAESKRLMALYQQLQGTYQVQVINSRDKVEIPLQYMDNIVSMRQQNEVTYFYYPNKKNVRIMILPYSEIQSKDFVPVQQVAYITE
ncbi:MAG: hypothetical protein HY064_08425 [Bacteroidetes bacterium]|nr:hypothetical protein [Bacteroidota bacterium]